MSFNGTPLHYEWIIIGRAGAGVPSRTTGPIFLVNKKFKRGNSNMEIVQKQGDKCQVQV